MLMPRDLIVPAIGLLIVSILLRWMFKAATQKPNAAGRDRNFNLEVVGESHYQRNLKKICGPRKKDGEKLEMVAVLIPESDNKYDPNAVKVLCQDLQLGYLSRDNAKLYRNRFGSGQSECRGIIVGGWDRGERDKGHYGIWLEFDL